MAIQWNWDEKCGEAIFKQTIDGVEETHTANLYVGNAYLIMIYEWTEDNQEKYEIKSFWVDKQHMKNCLGLNRKGGWAENIHNTDYDRLIKIRLNKKMFKHLKDIVSALIQAFDNIEIEIFTE